MTDAAATAERFGRNTVTRSGTPITGEIADLMSSASPERTPIAVNAVPGSSTDKIAAMSGGGVPAGALTAPHRPRMVVPSHEAAAWTGRAPGSCARRVGSGGDCLTACLSRGVCADGQYRPPPSQRPGPTCHLSVDWSQARHWHVGQAFACGTNRAQRRVGAELPRQGNSGLKYCCVAGSPGDVGIEHDDRKRRDAVTGLLGCGRCPFTVSGHADTFDLLASGGLDRTRSARLFGGLRNSADIPGRPPPQGNVRAPGAAQRCGPGMNTGCRDSTVISDFRVKNMTVVQGVPGLTSGRTLGHAPRNPAQGRLRNVPRSPASLCGHPRLPGPVALCCRPA